MLHRIRFGGLAVAFIIMFIVPIWSLVQHSGEVRTDFTWDMFAERRDCERCTVYFAIGDEEPVRLSWGRRGDPEELDALAFGPLVLDANRPFLNLRAPPQIARMRNEQRLQRLATDVCSTFDTLFTGELEGTLELPETLWLARMARAWDANGRHVRFYADCVCRYNNRPTCEVAEDCPFPAECVSVSDEDEELRVCARIVGDMTVDLCGGE